MIKATAGVSRQRPPSPAARTRSDAAPTGVLVLAHGGPRCRSDVDRFYTSIRRGRPPSDAELLELVGRYDAIGGSSPLNERTKAQSVKLAELLGHDFIVGLGMKHSPPTIEQATQELVNAGVRRIVAVVLAPHYSLASVGQYLARAREALGAAVRLEAVESWHDHADFVKLLAGRVAEELDAMPTAEVVFTAHSLPVSVSDSSDYRNRLAATADAVACRLGLPFERWRIAWQSGRRSGDWLGPDILETISDAARRGRQEVVACPAGFVVDHLETLFDLDIEAARHARSFGVTFTRTRALDEDLCPLLADLVRGARGACAPGAGA